MESLYDTAAEYRGNGTDIQQLLGAVFGLVVFLWIVFGSILGGAVHDYMSGVISVRMNGASLSEIIGKYLGNAAKQFMRVFSIFLMILVGAVFTKSPAELLSRITPAYVVLGIQLDVRKDILGVWIGENESAKFWLMVMNDLKNRGVKDVYVFCVDGLTGFREAINAAFPKSQIQRCIIHQIRSSTRYVSYKDIKALMADLKKVYQAINEDEAMNALLEFKEK